MSLLGSGGSTPRAAQAEKGALSTFLQPCQPQQIINQPGMLFHPGALLTVPHSPKQSSSTALHQNDLSWALCSSPGAWTTTITAGSFPPTLAGAADVHRGESSSLCQMSARVQPSKTQGLKEESIRSTEGNMPENEERCCWAIVCIQRQAGGMW